MATRKQRGGNRKRPTAWITTKWQKDPSIMARLRVVEALWDQPLNRILEAVNEKLRREQLPEVTYDVIKDDRQRVLAIARDRVLAPGKDSLIEHTMSLMTMMTQAQRDALAVPPGPARAPLYAIALRAREDLMRIDGTWTRGAIGALEEDEEQQQERFAPAPEDLLQAGIVTQEDVMAHLRILAGRSRKKLPAHPDDVIEGTLVDEGGAPNLAPRPGTATAASKAAPTARRPSVRVAERDDRSAPPDLPPPNMPREGGMLDEFVPEPWE